MKIVIINGPNLNLLGKREVDIYGGEPFESFFKKLQAGHPGIEISYFQSNVGGERINEIQRVGFSYDGMSFKPCGYTHTSVAIGDSIASMSKPFKEVHISNIFGREDFRKISHVSGKAKGVISGLGLKGYELALTWFT